MIWLRRLRKNQKGQSLVELALVLPVITLVLFGILELGLIFHSYLVLTNAVREGARAGALGKTDSEITARIMEAATLPQVDTNLTVTSIEPEPASRTTGNPLTVEATYGVDLITPLFSSFLPNPFTLTAQATMRIE